jgi:hypothetical protein
VGPAGGHRKPVTITDLAVVKQLATLVNDLQLSTIGPDASCPAVAWGQIRLTFRARIGGPPLAVAQAPEPCGTVELTVGGKQQPALQITDQFIRQVLKVAKLDWKIG